MFKTVFCDASLNTGKTKLYNLSLKSLSFIYKYIERLTKSCKLKIKLDEIKKEHNDIAEYIDNVINRIKSDEIFIQIENDGIFRSFENSVDILLKTVFERFNENKSQDFAYINEILKYKVNNIFYSKLL